MLIQFGIKNMTSFKEETVFSLMAYSRLTRHKESIRDVGKYKVLKSAVLYGPNASGKSNIFQSLGLFINFILGKENPEKNHSASIYYPFFLSTETDKKPSSFFIEFYLEDIKSFFRYEISILEKEIVSESLKQQIGKNELLLFSRKLDCLDAVNQKYFEEGEKVKTLHALSKEIPLISLSSFLNGFLSQKILSFFKTIKYLQMPFIGQRDFTERIKDEGYRSRIEVMLKKADLGFSKLSYKTTSAPDNHAKFYVPILEHNVYDSEHKLIEQKKFSSYLESTGTVGFLHLIPVILETLNKGGVLVIDELEASLHPLLVAEIIKLFNSHTNVKGQLIFSAHNTSFLSQRLFRKDQVYFAEKNRYGESSLFSLLDYKDDAREDVNWENRYLAGLYGAIPSLKSLERMC